MSMMKDAMDLENAKNYLKTHFKDKKFKNKRFGDSYAYEKDGKREVLSNGLVSNNKVFNFSGGKFSSRSANVGESSNIRGIFSTKRVAKVKKASTGRSSG